MPSGSITLSGLPSGHITDCRVLTAHNSPNYQPPSPLSGPSLKAACQPPSPPSMSTLTTRRMLCLKSAVPENLLDLLWQVHSLTACLLLSQEDASAGTLRALWTETLLPVYPGSVAPGDHIVAPWKGTHLPGVAIKTCLVIACSLPLHANIRSQKEFVACTWCLQTIVHCIHSSGQQTSTL